jgi:hypothetical protein
METGEQGVSEARPCCAVSDDPGHMSAELHLRTCRVGVARAGQGHLDELRLLERSEPVDLVLELVQS